MPHTQWGMQKDWINTQAKEQGIGANILRDVKFLKGLVYLADISKEVWDNDFTCFIEIINDLIEDFGTRKASVCLMTSLLTLRKYFNMNYVNYKVISICLQNQI